MIRSEIQDFINRIRASKEKVAPREFAKIRVEKSVKPASEEDRALSQCFIDHYQSGTKK